MGPHQEAWFYKSLSESKDRRAVWRIVGNQIVFSRIFQNEAGDLSSDNWSVRTFLTTPSEETGAND
jgi:alkaline phosphatase D